jgi:hypothetical protein
MKPITINKVMRYILKTILIILSFHHLSLKCQYDEWTTPVALTDSLTDNRNAIVRDLNYFNGYKHYMFWEKSFDTATTHIYSTEYYNPEEPFAVIEGNYHNSEPCFLRVVNWTYPPYSNFFLFYLSDRDGEYDIYYRIYSPDGYLDEVRFSFTQGNEKHIRSNGMRGLTWEYEGKIMYSRLIQEPGGTWYFIDPIVIDSGNCKNPEIEPSDNQYESYLIWEKLVEDKSIIMISHWYQSAWGTPEIFYSEGNNTNLSFESYGTNFQTTICWSNQDENGNYKIICKSPDYNEEFILDMGQDQQYYPVICNIQFGVNQIWDYAVLSFISHEEGQAELYVPENAWLSSFPGFYFNLSQTAWNEMNPALFNGIYYSGNFMQDVINIWESFQNGHWQLYTSKIQVYIPTKITENIQGEFNLLEISPNPFTDKVKLSFKSEIAGKASVVLYDGLGQQVGVLMEPAIQLGDQSWVFDPEKITGHELPAGIFFISLQVEGSNFSVKFVKSGD